MSDRLFPFHRLHPFQRAFLRKPAKRVKRPVECQRLIDARDCVIFTEFAFYPPELAHHFETVSPDATTDKQT